MGKRPAALVAAVLALWVCGAAGAPRVQGAEQRKAGAAAAQAAQPSAWEAQVLEALRTPPDHPRRVMLVFPLVEKGNKEGKLGWDRGLIALQAMWRSSFAPDRLLDTWDSFLPSLFVDQQMIGPGRTVTPQKIENTCATFECANYTTGTLAMDARMYTAELTFHGEHGERPKSYTGPRNQIHLLPCLIAQDVLDYLRVRPTAQQRAVLAEPTLTSTEQLDRVAAGFYYMSENMFWTAQWRIALVGEGRTQWTEDFVLWEAPYDQATFYRHMSQLPGIKERLAVKLLRATAVWQNAAWLQGRAASIEEGSKPPDVEAVRAAWKEAASQLLPLLKEDPYNPWLLGLATRAVGNAGSEQLHKAACERYELVFGKGVRARMHRGAMLVEEAWDARGSGYANTVTDAGWRRFGELLSQAAGDLDAAAKIEPRAWPVQRELITLAMGMGRPRSEAQAAWQAAMDACPTDYWACSSMLWYLQPRWLGTPQSQLAEANRIAATGDPQACIPRLLPESYWDLAQSPSEDDDRYADRREILSESDVAAEVIPALERCIEANPEDYASRTMLLAVAYWRQDRDRVAKLTAAIGRPGLDEVPATLDERYATRYLYAEILDWLDHPDSSPLIAAARGGWMPELKKLLAAKADVNKARDDGATPLVLAAHFGHPAAVRLLLGAGANPNAQDHTGSTALHWMVEYNWPKLVSLLLEHKADPNLRNEQGFTPLHIACRWWDRGPIAEDLLRHGADTSLLDKEGWAPLHLAATYGYEDQVRSLLAHGADVNILSGTDAQTPLREAAWNGRIGVMELLVKAGADVNRQFTSGGTALSEAVANGRGQVAQWLLAHGATDDLRVLQHLPPLALAASNGQTDRVRDLLAGGAAPNGPDDRGLTPLHWCGILSPDKAEAACAIARLLLHAGAKVDAQAGDGRTPLFCAAQHGRRALAKALLDAGANVNQPDKDGRSPLAICRDAPADGVEIAALLVEHGADVKSRDSAHMTALHWAALLGNLKMADLLLQHGAELEARQEIQRTPLWLAAAGGHPDVVRFLAGKGAKVNAGDKWDLTPLHAAAGAGDSDVVNALLKLGADPSALNNEKLTPADLAERGGHPEVARVLRDAELRARPGAGG